MKKIAIIGSITILLVFSAYGQRSNPSGNTSGDIRNDIAWRDEWVKTLEDAISHLRANPPVFAQVVYNPDLTQGSINYERRTVDFSFDFFINIAAIPSEYLEMMRDINERLNATGRNGDWRLNLLTPELVWNIGRERAAISSFGSSLLNNDGQIISRGGYPWRSSMALPFSGSGSRGDSTAFTGRGSRDDSTAAHTSTFTVNADAVTDSMSVAITASFTVRDMTFPLEVITIAEFNSRLTASGGLPPMETGSVQIYRGSSNSTRHRVPLRTELANTGIEKSFGLAGRSRLAAGDAFMILGGFFIPGAVRENAYGPVIIDTTGYRFPVSVAIFSGTLNRLQINRIFDMQPGQIERLNRGEAVLIVPQGWFRRNSVSPGDRIGFTFDRPRSGPTPR